MEITLKQTEIEQGIVAYLNTQGIDTTSTDISIKLIAGRKGSGHSAVVDLQPQVAQVLVPTAVQDEVDLEEKEAEPLFG